MWRLRRYCALEWLALSAEHWRDFARALHYRRRGCAVVERSRELKVNKGEWLMHRAHLFQAETAKAAGIAREACAAARQALEVYDVVIGTEHHGPDTAPSAHA